MNWPAHLRTACCCVVLLAAATCVQAQRGGGPPGGGGGGRPGGGMPMGGGTPGFPGGVRGSGGSMRPQPNGTNMPLPGGASNAPGTTSTMRGGLQLGPPGRWWDDKGFAQAIGLRKDQQKKMDAVFNANKSAILENYKSLVREEAKLEASTREPQLDKARIFAGIDAVSQARAGLEKANAQMLLQIRQEMDSEQVAKMDKFREKPAEDAAN